MYRHSSHADVIASRLVLTDMLDGTGKESPLKLTSLDVEQRPSNDISRLLALALIVGYRIGQGNRDRIHSASRQEVVHVLNWCGLGAGRFEQVLHSHISARSVTEDHLDAFHIRISEAESSELLTKTNNATGQWYRGDQLPPLLQETVSFVAGVPAVR